MKTTERIFQAILFEVTTLAIIVPTTVEIAGFDADKMLISGILLSLFAMFWNYFYNIVFDKLAGSDRITRGLVTRIIHASGFELGMLAITLPALAWYLEISWLAAIALEASFLVFILIYTLVFNWVYDKYQPYKKLISSQC